MARIASLSPYFIFRPLSTVLKAAQCGQCGLHELHQHDLAAVVGEILPVAAGIDQAKARRAAQRARRQTRATPQSNVATIFFMTISP